MFNNVAYRLDSCNPRYVNRIRDESVSSRESGNMRAANESAPNGQMGVSNTPGVNNHTHEGNMVTNSSQNRDLWMPLQLPSHIKAKIDFHDSHYQHLFSALKAGQTDPDELKAVLMIDEQGATDAIFTSPERATKNHKLVMRDLRETTRTGKNSAKIVGYELKAIHDTGIISDTITINKDNKYFKTLVETKK